MGSFYGNIIDLSADIQNTPEAQNPPPNMNETVVLENKSADETIGADRSELILTIVNDPTEAGNESEDEVDDYNSPVAYRPPTPPKISPKNSPVLPLAQSNSFTTASKGNLNDSLLLFVAIEIP